jgi:hypothetical protein
MRINDNKPPGKLRVSELLELQNPIKPELRIRVEGIPKGSRV